MRGKGALDFWDKETDCTEGGEGGICCQEVKEGEDEGEAIGFSLWEEGPRSLGDSFHWVVRRERGESQRPGMGSGRVERFRVV